MTQVPVPSGLTAEARAEIAALLDRSLKARGTVMQAVQSLAKQADRYADKIPDAARPYIVSATETALAKALALATAAHRTSWVPRLPDWGHQAVSTTTGAVAGLVPVAGAAELAVSVPMIFAAILREAEGNGFDLSEEPVLAEALRVFGDASPFPDDDATDLSFLTLRLTLATGALDAVLAAAAARLAVAMAPKLAASAGLIVGAIAGGGINYAYMGYFQEMARVRFRLLRLAQLHGPDAVHGAVVAARLAVAAQGAVRAASPASP